MHTACRISVSFLSLILLSGYGCDGNTAQKRLEKISTAYCECTAQLAAINRQADTAAPERLNVYFKQMESEYTRAKECTAMVVGQFGRLKAAQLDSVQALLNTKCPHLAGNRDLLQELLGE